MKPTQYARVGEIFAVVCDLDEPEQAKRLDELCGDDVELRREVQTMLRHDGAEEELIVSPPAGDDASRAPLPENIGPFRVTGYIAEGGMGTVLEAEQDAPRRAVALKVIRGGFASASMLRRFEHEGQVLGRLEHPGIARIYEAGTAETAFGRQPYFAMERVHGRSITEYARAHDLSPRARLEMVARTCDAVHHAHQKGVIHRDLKPANILIDEGTDPAASTSRKGEVIGQPKVLDFGVARVTDMDVRTTTLQTDVGQLVGTLQYMSPEQASGDPAEIDTRSDIYSIGVVTFELLTGSLPYPSDLRGMMIPAAVEVIRDGVTTRLGSVDARLRGDVETIVAKALSPEKDDRYDSAAAMAADIRRYLVDEPIVARPPSAWYQLSKFAKRNRPLLAGLAVAFALLLVALGATAFGMVRARQGERDALNVADFLIQTWESSLPDAEGLDVQVRTVVIDAARLLDDADSPFSNLNRRVEARLRLTVGSALRSYGELEAARVHLDRALALHREQGAPPLELAQAINERARLHALFEEFEEARLLWTEVLSLPVPPVELLRARNHLGVLARDRGEHDRAERLLSAVFAEREALLGATHVDTLFSQSALGKTYALLDRRDEAERIFRDVYDVRSRTFGEEDLLTLSAAITLGRFLSDQADYEEAVHYLRIARDGQSEALGEDHPDTLRTIADLATVYSRSGRGEEAVSMLEELCRIQQEKDPDAGATLIALNRLGIALERLERYEEAIPVLEEALRGRRAGPAPEGPRALSAMYVLGRVYRRAGRLDDAEQLHLEAYEGQKQRPDSKFLRQIMNEIANVWLDRGDAGRVPPLEAAETALTWTTGALGTELDAPSESPPAWVATCLGTHGRALAMLDRHDDAEEALLRCLDIRTNWYGETHARTRAALVACAELYRQWGRPAPEHLQRRLDALDATGEP